MPLSRKQKKDLARDYYINNDLTQKEISEKVGVTEKTLSKWVAEKDYEWKKLKGAIQSTFEHELIRLKNQVTEFNNYIESKPEGERFGSSSEYDALTKLRRFIDYFEKHPVSSVISIMQEFLTWYKEEDLEKAKELSGAVDAFIRSKL